jgi:hypothetical protein
VNLVGGVVAVNVLFLATGYAPLARGLRGATWSERASWAGVALLVGAGAVGTAVFFSVIAGAHATLGVAVLCAAALGALGALARIQVPRPAAPARSTALLALVAAVCVLGVIGGFRSAPWLDDAWAIWLPKGVALWHFGLDERLFVPNGDYVTFGVPDYPLWWSIVTSLDMQATRDLVEMKNSLYNVDVRVMCAELALLTTAFVAAVARLLWGYVRMAVLAPSLLVIVLAPELWRQVQGGVADLPLALYVALAVLSALLWLRTDATFHLALAAFSAAVALQIKTEALPEVVVLGAIGVALCRDRRLLLAWLAALATALPWLAWRWAHDVPSRAWSLDLDRLDRVPPTLGSVFGHLLDPTEWLVVVPLFVALALLARRPRFLLVPAALTLVVVVAYWIDRDEIRYVLNTSAYRVIDPIVLTAAVLVPLLAEAFLQEREALREDRRLVRQS